MRLTILRILFLLCLVPNQLLGETLSNRSFFIYDAREGSSTVGSIDSALESWKSGVAITLKYSAERDEVYIPVKDSVYSVDDFFRKIEDLISLNRDLFIPLFISPSGNYSKIWEELEDLGIDKIAYQHSPGESWPSVESITDGGDNIVIFTFDRIGSIQTYLNYSWDYIAELPYSGEESPEFSGFYAHGSIENELLMLDDFISSHIKNGDMESLELDINLKSFYINYPIEAWKLTGKRPNFMFVTTPPKHLGTIHGGIIAYSEAEGVIKSNSVPLKSVEWIGDDETRSITGGRFSFPYTDKDKLELKPYAPGYMFDDESIEIGSLDDIKDEYLFNVSPSSIYDDLSALFTFEDGIVDVIDRYNSVGIDSCLIVTDKERGSVMKMFPKGSINIGNGDKYGIYNGSFSVSVWIKIADYELSPSYSILGSTTSGFRKGLHMVVRERYPYFGFWGNDLSTGYEISANRWYHIVYRYNSRNGEQAIFVNGTLRGSSTDHQSYIGEQDLLMGRSLGGGNENSSVGYWDDFAIWSRALGEDEVFKLYSSGFDDDEIVDTKREKSVETTYIVIIVILILILIALTTVIIRLRLDRVEGVSIDSLADDSSSDPNITCKVMLMGKFAIYNRAGAEVSSQIGDKLTQVLLTIMVYSTVKDKGVRISTLTDELWPGTSSKRATNSRNVAINKLRKFLEVNEIGEIINDRNRLKINFNRDFSCDLADLYRVRRGIDMDIDINKIELLIGTVERGALLQDYDLDWLVDIKEEVSSILVTLLTSSCRFIQRADNLEIDLGFRVADRLMVEDDLSERALNLQLQILFKKGKDSHAKYHYKRFAEKYSKVYNESFEHNWSYYQDKYSGSGSI